MTDPRQPSLDVIVDRLQRLADDLRAIGERVSANERNYASLGVLPVQIARIERDIQDLKAHLEEMRKTQAEREQWFQSFDIQRQNMGRSTQLTVIGLISSSIIFLAGTAVTILLRLSGNK